MAGLTVGRMLDCSVGLRGEAAFDLDPLLDVFEDWRRKSRAEAVEYCLLAGMVAAKAQMEDGNVIINA